MSDARISPDKDDIRKVLWYLKQVSLFGKDNSLVGSIATSIIANEVEKMKGKNIFKYSLKRNEKAKPLPMKTSLKISSKGGATFVSDLLLIYFKDHFLANDYTSFNNCKVHELWVYSPALFELTI